MLVRAVLTFTLLVGSAGASAQESCELHIFPTKEVTLFTKLGNYGLLTEALAGSAPPKEIILQNLPVDVQFDAAKNAVMTNARFANYSFSLNERVIDYKSAVKTKERLSTSPNGCYAELVLVNIAYSDSALTAKKIGIMSVLREFSDASGKPKITKLGGAAKLAMFPTEEAATREVVRQDLAQGFREAFKQSVEKFLKPKR